MNNFLRPKRSFYYINQLGYNDQSYNKQIWSVLNEFDCILLYNMNVVLHSVLLIDYRLRTTDLDNVTFMNIA